MVVAFALVNGCLGMNGSDGTLMDTRTIWKLEIARSFEMIVMTFYFGGSDHSVITSVLY